MSESESLEDALPEQGRNRYKALFIIVGTMAGLLVLGILFAVAQFTLRATQDGSFETEQAVQAVEIDVDRGSVDLIADRPRGADLATRLEYFLRAPDLRAAEEGGAVSVGADCDWPSDCEIDVAGRVQRGADIVVRTSSGGATVAGAPGTVSLRSTNGPIVVEDAAGDVNVGSLSGSLRIERAAQAVRAESRSGLVTVRDHSGPLRVRTATGFVVGEGLRSREAAVEVGSGRIELTYDRAPERLEVDLSEGILEVEVPRGRYRIDVDQALGEVDVTGIQRDPEAERRLVLRVNQGNVTVRGV